MNQIELWKTTADVGTEFQLAGKVYTAVHMYGTGSNVCAGCAFNEFNSGCSDSPNCSKNDVIFVEAK